ncbi:bifunctional lysine-specific demethylase and histidyl-hydroxylase NO66-like [Schistocerca gregaria]|uniref:bifunctional lysine-specific demethylase and histidyl-hydroxylase NO66-like n=1 Tax=Schistocerca gregaria TaxID=7010 RepID=UPI00211F33BF|nr:bifunctional lysine-specific demethylase and histidyl-hydroxylase NO66-like [Schistocerca gregaria]
MDSPTCCSKKKSSNFLAWFLWPLPVSEFFSHYFEQKTFAAKKKIPDYWTGWCSSAQLEKNIRDDAIWPEDAEFYFYSSGQRFCIAPSDRQNARSDALWELFETSRLSVKIQRAHQYFENVQRMLSLLEEALLLNLSCEAFYVPSGAQASAPKRDETDSFFLIVEGSIQCNLYGAPDKTKSPPLRDSDPSVQTNEFGEPSTNTSLNAGDILYLPRGTIYEIHSHPELQSSLYLVISLSSNFTWTDFLQAAVLGALNHANSTYPEFRKTLPKGYANYVGVMHSDLKHSEKRKAFLTKAMALCKVLCEKALMKPSQFDDAADQMMRQFLRDRQPPQLLLSKYEQGFDSCDAPYSSTSSTHDRTPDNPRHPPEQETPPDVTESTKFRLVTRHCLRLVIETNALVYYTSPPTDEDPSHPSKEKKIEMPIEYAEAIDYLWKTYPKYVRVDELPLEHEEQRIELASELLDKQIAMVE